MIIHVCDDCKLRDREAERLCWPTGKFSPDPAGGPSTEQYEEWDLCLHCAIKRLVQERKFRRAAEAGFRA